MSTTTLSFQSESRPEAMADVPGICELPLTRAVVQYRDIHEIDLLGGKIQDIGPQGQKSVPVNSRGPRLELYRPYLHGHSEGYQIALGRFHSRPRYLSLIHI